jgi:radical SAM protein with 4Fe4S-binding SPASM domain
MGDPVVELPLLYRCTGLLARHPVRVTVPFRPGLARTVKLGLSLGFTVRLHGHQPSPEAVAEARHALAEYLHNPTVSQPVEPFHSLLISVLHEKPVALWSLLERDPAEVRLIDERGEPAPGQGPASVVAFRDALVAAGGDCRYLSCCDGYFKWPHSDYACTGVKSLFGKLFDADSLDSLLAQNPVRESFHRRPMALVARDCIDCDYLALCHGGCPVRTFSVHGTLFEKDPDCELYRSLFAHMASAAARLARDPPGR